KEAREAGADDVLTKPFQSIREMLNKVGAYLTGRPYKPEAEDDPRPLGISSPPLSSSPPPSPQPAPPPFSSAPALRETVVAPPPETATVVAAADDDAVSTDHQAAPSSLSAAGDAIDEGPAASRADDEAPFVTSPIEVDALDDQTIEVKPMADVADNHVSSSAPASELPVAEVSAFAAPTDENANPTNLESSMSLPSEERYPEPTFTSPMTPPIQRPAASNASKATDDSLLDLGEQQSALASAAVPTLSDNDDMILDLGEDPVYAAPAWNQPPMSSAPTAASPDQLSPEAIDAIARRVAELLSTRAIEDVAWEVVPQLAELLIKQQLEAGKLRKQ
ncbi:MAG TPA: hypothetical protein VM870_02120, partial [Pyrinomonadaceae bacterium]|nr:hypothetical protein [Pyrinomonadaceae bacterium]